MTAKTDEGFKQFLDERDDLRAKLEAMTHLRDHWFEHNERNLKQRAELEAKLAAYGGVPTEGPGSHKQDLAELRLCQAKLAANERACFEHKMRHKAETDAALARVKELEKIQKRFERYMRAPSPEQQVKLAQETDRADAATDMWKLSAQYLRDAEKRIAELEELLWKATGGP